MIHGFRFFKFFSKLSILLDFFNIVPNDKSLYNARKAYARGYLSKIDAFTEQLIITTGTSTPHISAISKKITEVLKKNKIKIYGFEGRGSKDWVLIDLGEVVLNIMSSSARELYDLESLWDPNL